MKILEKIWSFMPDTCEVRDCCRKGVRGNENRVYPFPDDDLWKEFYIVMCDYCSSRYERGEVMGVHGNLPRLITKPKGTVIDFVRRQKEKKYDSNN